jgi:hypothetical protein
MREFIDRIQGLWCETVHKRALWPIHGKYRCATCLREYAVGFEQTVEIPRPGGSCPIGIKEGPPGAWVVLQAGRWKGVVLGAHAVDSTFPTGAQR